MDLKDIVGVVPQILLFIVPGFLTLKLIEAMTPQKGLEQNETILWSILYSFVVMIIYSFIQRGLCWLTSVCCCSKVIEFITAITPPRLQEIENKISYSMIAWHLLIAVAFAYVHIKIFSSKIGEKITRFFNKNIIPGEDLWFKALKSEEGVYARVYLKNGLVYYGVLSDFTANSDDTTKLIVLQKFEVFYGPLSDKPKTLLADAVRKISEGTYNPEDEYFTVIRDYTTKEKPVARVLLRYDDIVSIELL